MVDFKKLKAQSGNVERLAKAIEKSKKGSSFNNKDDETFWYPELDKAGNAYAVIRFLPTAAVDDPECEGDVPPFIKIFSYGFQGPNGDWYIENSLATLGQKDPAGEYKNKIWKTNEELAKTIKRNVTYISNIYVLEDPKNPENEGKVFKFRYGAQIFRKIEAAQRPNVDEDGNPIPGAENLVPVDPFDLWQGSNFKLRIRKLNDRTNYETSSFVKDADDQVISSVLSDDEKVLESIWNSEYSLKELIAPDKFKSYDELKERFYRVMGLDGEDWTTKPLKSEAEKVKTETVETEDDDVPFDPPHRKTEDRKPVEGQKTTKAKAKVVEEEDDDMAEFRRIAEED